MNRVEKGPVSFSASLENWPLDELQKMAESRELPDYAAAARAEIERRSKAPRRYLAGS